MTMVTTSMVAINIKYASSETVVTAQMMDASGPENNQNVKVSSAELRSTRKGFGLSHHKTNRQLSIVLI